MSKYLPMDVYDYWMKTIPQECPQQLTESKSSVSSKPKSYQAEYIWIGGSGQDLRSKTKTVIGDIKSLSDLPVWNYDGSSTNQAPGKDSEVYLKPVAYYPDPFRTQCGQNIGNVLVLCEACLPDEELTPIPTNTRRKALDVMTRAKDSVPWFGIEQEYTLFEKDGRTPLGWPKDGKKILQTIFTGFPLSSFMIY
jgi:glutamine synthetase